MKHTLAALSFGFAVGICGFADAQFFSPGRLARPHAPWGGDDLAHCAKCHVENQGLSAERCLACHPTLAARIARGTGFHGRMPAAKREPCQTCHPEHRGSEHALVDWQAEGGREHFGHAQTGWPLEGGHAKTACASCHDKRLVRDPAVKQRIEQHPGSTTYLGLSVACADCHVDEHRGQLGGLCEKCHGIASWKLSAPFDHQKTAYPLVDKHAAVPCGKCHPKVMDGNITADASAKPRDIRYVRYKPVEHGSCLSCHKDPHKGDFGVGCTSCHSEAGWKAIGAGSSAMPASFHDKTKYPLRGRHVGVPCRSCHVSGPGQAAKYKGLPYQKCSSCHSDAHLAQLGPKEKGEQQADCAACHTVNGFLPAQFELEQHASTRFPLEGAHRAVPCRSCHQEDRTLERRIPADLRGKLKAQKRPERFSFVVMRPNKQPNQCVACHKDVHRGELASAERGNDCTRCHGLTSFTEVTFDHDRQSSYPLTGKHKQVPCGRCHIRGFGVGHVSYRPTATQCDACHQDVHGGQFLYPEDNQGPLFPKPDNRRCEHCHQTSGFKDLRFNHDDLAFSTYPLEGKHKEVKCDFCHRPVPLMGRREVVRYRPLPRACVACHVEAHRGAPRCQDCHDPTGFSNIRYDHDGRTPFPLEGAHKNASCRVCHANDFAAPVPTTCIGCHRDRHAGEFGNQCSGCHDERSWRPLYQADAHRRSNFPLAGRHAAIPCQECHAQSRDRAFDRAPLGCVACHQANLDRARSSTVNHLTLGKDCQRCHSTVAFTPALFAGHETCFPITGSPHGGVRCASCHTVVPTSGVTGACTTGTAACTSCHTHTCAKSDRKHREVLGYQCSDRKCFECHRGGR